MKFLSVGRGEEDQEEERKGGDGDDRVQDEQLRERKVGRRNFKDGWVELEEQVSEDDKDLII